MYSKKAVWAFILVLIYPTISILSLLADMFAKIFNIGLNSSFSFLIYYMAVPGILMSVIGLILGIISLKDIRNTPDLRGRSLARWAIALFILQVLMVIVFFGIALSNI